jgi:hypothetical protein
MLPISAKDTFRLEPDGEGGPAYLIKTPTFLERAAWRRDVAAAGARYPGDVALFQALKDDLKAVGPDNLADLIGMVDEVAVLDRAERTPEVMAPLDPIVAMVRALGGAYARLEGEQAFWLDVAPYQAARRFLVGAVGAAVTVKQAFGTVSEATLNALPANHVTAIGWKAIDLMTLTGTAAKN